MQRILRRPPTLSEQGIQGIDLRGGFPAGELPSGLTFQVSVGVEAIRSSGILDLSDTVSPVELTKNALEAIATTPDDAPGPIPPIIISAIDSAGAMRAAMLAVPFGLYPDDIALSPVYWTDHSWIEQLGAQREFHATFIALALNALHQEGYRGLVFELRPRALRSLISQMPFTVLDGDQVVAEVVP